MDVNVLPSKNKGSFLFFFFSVTAVKRHFRSTDV